MKGTRLPEDWTLPADWRLWAEQKRPDLDIDEQGEIFHDYWIAIPGAKGLKCNWKATWRNHIRRAWGGQNKQVSRNGGVSQSFHENLRDIADELSGADILPDAGEVRPQMGLGLSDQRADQAWDESLGDYISWAGHKRH